MRITVSLIFTALLTLSSGVWADQSKYSLDTAPSANIDPADVVQIVVDALRLNDPDSGDNGIATVWRFAAPSNKAMTGPLDRFTQMLKGGYGDMLNHIDSDYGPIEVQDDIAIQPVWLTTPKGDEVAYVFQLRRQGPGAFEGMWMTESVYPIAPKRRGTAI